MSVHDSAVATPSQDDAGGIASSDLPDGTRVRMWGAVDESLRAQASTVMAHALGREGRLMMDVGDVEFLDSSGLAFILQMLRAAEEDGRYAELRDPPTLLIDMLDILGLTGAVPLTFTSR